jgi:hypothetical protein
MNLKIITDCYKVFKKKAGEFKLWSEDLFKKNSLNISELNKTVDKQKEEFAMLNKLT